MNSTICSAIRSKRMIQCFYDGGIRTVEPFCHGESRDGNALLRVYQTAGYSQSGQPDGWKLFPLDELSGLAITNESAFGLKSIAQAMQGHGHIQTKWESGPADGLGAMVGRLLVCR